MKSRLKRIILLVIMYTSLFMFLFMTNPNKLAIGWLIIPFIWLFIVLYLSVLFIFDITGYKAHKPKRKVTTAVLIAAIPSLILLLDSIDQLTLKDGLLIVILGLIASFYTNKFKVKSKQM